MDIEEIEFEKQTERKTSLEKFDTENVTKDQFSKPKKRKWYEYLYDKKEGTCCLRTPIGWLRLFIFYLIFFSCLTAVVLISCQFLFLHNYLPLDPTLKKAGPGVSVQPSFEESKSIYIKVKRTDKTKLNEIVQKVSRLIDEYKESSAKVTNSTNDDGVVSIDNMFGECNKETFFGYKAGRPCILIKVNKKIGFKPDPYDPFELPKDMPKTLVNKILSLPENEREYVWISCLGLTMDDTKFLGNVVYYPPHQGIKKSLFPLETHPVAVQFPSIKLNEKITVECRIWAKNIKYKKTSFRHGLYGSVIFDIQIE